MTSKWRFKEDKWPLWNAHLYEKLKTQKLTAISNPKRAYNTFYRTLINTTNKFFKPPKKKNRREAPNWWNADCKKALAAARKARRKWLKNPFSITLKTHLNRAEAVKKRTILRAKRESWLKYLKSLETTKNPKEFWNYVRRVITGVATTQQFQ